MIAEVVSRSRFVLHGDTNRGGRSSRILHQNFTDLLFLDQYKTLRSVRLFARHDSAPAGIVKSRQKTQKYITKVIRSNLGADVYRMAVIDSLNWTAAPLLLHIGITSRPS